MLILRMTAIKQKGIEKKKEISKALKYFEEQKRKVQSLLLSQWALEDTSD